MPKAEKNLAQLELLILLAVRRLSAQDRHCQKIVDELENNTGRWVTFANIFTSLRSMTKKGYLISRVEEQIKSGPGRKKKSMFELTSLGDDVMNLAVRDVYSLAEGSEGLWGRISASAKRYAQLRCWAFQFS